jgi:hypothetical protein
MASTILTAEEEHVLLLLKQAWDEFALLKVVHPADFLEFMQAIHQAQNIIMARPASLEQRLKDEPTLKAAG